MATCPARRQPLKPVTLTPKHPFQGCHYRNREINRLNFKGCNWGQLFSPSELGDHVIQNKVQRVPEIVPAPAGMAEKLPQLPPLPPQTGEFQWVTVATFLKPASSIRTGPFRQSPR